MRTHILDSPISYYAIFLSVRYFPVRLCHLLGKIVALIVYVFAKRDRQGLAFNISIALEKAPEDPFIKKTIRRIFINYGQYLVDFFLLPQFPPEKISKFFCRINGEEILKRALANGKGVILLSAHIGNWELGGYVLRMENHPLTVVALAHNTRATNALVNQMRKYRGIDVIEVGQSPFSGIEIMNHLRKNEIVAMIGDRDLLGGGLKVNFFGKEASFPIGPVVMAMKSGAALIPAFILRQPDGRYSAVLEEAIPLVLEGKKDELIKKNLENTVRVFERYIRQHPDQWYCPDPIITKD